MKTETKYSRDGEMFAEDDLGEAVRNAADNISVSGQVLPLHFTVYQLDFAQVPASHYLGRDYAGYLMESMDDSAYDLIGNDDFEGMFAKYEIDEEKLNSDLRTAIDTVFTKHGIHPKEMIANGGHKEHLIEWNGPNNWKVIKEHK